MTQTALFHDRFEDAAAATIDRCGGRKRFAVEMYPDKPVRDAHNLLDAQLNPERREKFSPSQVMYICRRGREVGCHWLITYMMRELGYADPQPVAPQEEAAELQRQFMASVDAQRQILARLERLQPSVGTTGLRAA